MDTDEFIGTTMRRVAASAAPPLHVPVTPARPRRWLGPLVVATAAAAVALIVVAASLIGGQRSDGVPATGTSTTTPPTSGACRVDYPPKPLPVWARAGFTPPEQPVSYVLGDRGDLAAIVWAPHHPLVAPPAKGRNNKILWVARVGASDGPLRIRATSTSTGLTVSGPVAPAPGPSTLDLPDAGCWSIDLSWGDHRDHLVLGYAAH